MASILKVDNLKGSSTAGEITITLENDESQILQQGIAKVTANIQADATLNSDASLNVSGAVDSGTGLRTLTITNAFSAIKSAVPCMENHDSSWNRGTNVDDASASVFILRIHQSSTSSLTDAEGDVAVTMHGDLA
jgi:hypothetical protein